MSIAREGKRIAGRRIMERRMYGKLHGTATEEEMQEHDRIWTRVWLCVNRRVKERRSGKGRRIDD